MSTTHVITSSVMGVGATRRLSAVRWGVAGNIVAAWVLTIPAAAAVAALVYLLSSRIVTLARLSGGAAGAGADDLDRVVDVDEALRLGDLPGPPLDLAALDLHGPAAVPADQVVVVPGAADPVDRLAVRAAQHVDRAGVGERLQVPVDRGQADRVAAAAQLGVQVLGAGEAVAAGQRRARPRRPAGSTVPSVPSSAHSPTGTGRRRTAGATTTDSTKNPQAASTIAAPAATSYACETASPTTPLAMPSSTASAVVGAIRSHHSRAAAAGATISATAWMVPTAGTEVTTVSSTSSSRSRSSRPAG